MIDQPESSHRDNQARNEDSVRGLQQMPRTSRGVFREKVALASVQGVAIRKRAANAQGVTDEFMQHRRLRPFSERQDSATSID